MAIYHLHVQNISRGAGRSVVAAAAYRAGERLWNKREERWSDFSRRGGIVHAEILTPEGAPAWMRQREFLWNGVEDSERRKDARLAKEINLALPRELGRNERLDLVRRYAGIFVDMGLVVDLAIHDNGDGNPHAHIMLTTRDIVGEAFGNKIRYLDHQRFIRQTRELWADAANLHLKGAGTRERIDHRTLEAQGIDRAPQVHQGVVVRRMLQRGRRPRSKVVRYVSRWRNAREVDYRPIDRGTRIERCEEVQCMSKTYDELVTVQRRLDVLESRRKAAEGFVDDRDTGELELRARREHLLRQVEREEIEAGLGLGEENQRTLLDGWDQLNRPQPADYREPERDDRPYWERPRQDTEDRERPDRDDDRKR